MLIKPEETVDCFFSQTKELKELLTRSYLLFIVAVLGVGNGNS